MCVKENSLLTACGVMGNRYNKSSLTSHRVTEIPEFPDADVGCRQLSLVRM